MFQHTFDLDGIEYIVTVSYFDPGSEGYRSGHPDNWTEDDPWEIELEDTVEVVGEDETDLDTFIEAYHYYFKVSETEAKRRIEQAVYASMIEHMEEEQIDEPREPY